MFLSVWEGSLGNELQVLRWFGQITAWVPEDAQAVFDCWVRLRLVG